jgi:hypothetical protein
MENHFVENIGPMRPRYAINLGCRRISAGAGGEPSHHWRNGW